MRYTIVDFAEKLFEEVLFKIIFWVLPKLGRILINWSKPCLTESMSLLELIFHYYAMKFKLESPWRFLKVYLKYLFRRNPSFQQSLESINRFFTAL